MYHPSCVFIEDATNENNVTGLIGSHLAPTHVGEVTSLGGIFYESQVMSVPHQETVGRCSSLSIGT